MYREAPPLEVAQSQRGWRHEGGGCYLWRTGCATEKVGLVMLPTEEQTGRDLLVELAVLGAKGG